MCELFSLCEPNVFVCGKACVRTVCVTHLLCAGGLEALWGKGLLVCDCLCDGLLVWVWNGVGWMSCEGWSPVWGCCGVGVVFGHDRNFPKIFGARDKLF